MNVLKKQLFSIVICVAFIALNAHGATPIKLNQELIPDGDAKGYLISPINDYVVYRADQNVKDVVELFAVPLNGGDTIGAVLHLRGTRE